MGPEHTAIDRAADPQLQRCRSMQLHTRGPPLAVKTYLRTPGALCPPHLTQPLSARRPPKQVCVWQDPPTSGRGPGFFNAVLHAMPLETARLRRRKQPTGRLRQHSGFAVSVGGGGSSCAGCRAVLVPSCQRSIRRNTVWPIQTCFPARMASPFAASEQQQPSRVTFAPGTQEKEGTAGNYALVASPRQAGSRQGRC
jgi:hypothetical protein